MKNLKLSHKLIVAFLSLGILPALLVTWIALHKSNAALEAKAYELLGSARENKKAQVHYYFGSIRKQISTLSNDTMIIDATKGFRTGYDNYLRESNIQPSDLATMRTSVRNYYTHEYLPEYQSQNAGSSITVDRLLNGIDDTGIALQYAYISNNSYPLGSKDGLTRAEGTATYHDLHEKYHPSIRHFLDEFGYYDIFILDPESGNIIYSVFKELDYGTSLKTGPYANTNFAEAFQVASRATEKNMTHLIDFEQYTPSYEAPASFMSSPIYDGDTLVGVLIFQMPIDRINQITGALTANSSDANTDNRAGLGETGEVYMVGSDNLLRSNSYFDQDKYSVVASFRNKQQGKIETEATEAALRNQSGEQIATNYKGNDVLTSYTPVDLGDGVTWALVAEIDSAEAHALIPQIRNAVLITLAVIAGLIIGCGLWLANSITAPLRRVFKGLKTFSNQEFNQMGDTFKKIGSDISLATQSISSMSGHISEASTNQAASLEETSASMEEISSVTQQNSEHAQQSSQLSAAAQSSVETGNQAMAEMSQVMGKIKASSEEIAGILKIIDDISFQTNILALNAAVEAARAGESGAGFAVVADEVRQLAQRTANASKDTAKLIQESVGNAKNGVQAGEHLTEILKKIETNVAQAAELAEGVSSASVEQSDGITQINGALTQLDSSTQRNAAESEELAAQSVQLTQVVKSLDALIGIQTPAAPQPATPSNALPHAPAPSDQLDGGWQSNHSDTADNHSDFTFTDTPNNRDFQDLHSN